MFSIAREYIRLALISSLYLLVASCSNNFKIIVVQNGATELLFYNDGIIFDSRFAPCLKEVTVFTDTQPASAVWLVRAAGQDCIQTESVIIGRVPRGFHEVVPMDVLSPDTRVLATAIADSGRAGISESWSF